MTFNEALTLAHESEKLVGTKYNGETIDEILIVPTDKVLHDQFIKEYCYTLDAQAAILPFIHADVEVVALFKKEYIQQCRVLVTTSIDSIQ